MGIDFTLLLVIVFVTIVLTLWLVGFLARLIDQPRWLFWTMILLCGGLLIYLTWNLFQIIPRFIHLPPVDTEIRSQDEALEETKKRMRTIQAFYTSLLVMLCMILNIVISVRGLRSNGVAWSKILGWIFLFEILIFVLFLQLF